VAEAFGLGDILRTKPIDITKGATGQEQAQQRYAVVLSTIAEMIESSSTTAANITQALAKIRDSFKDGKFDSTDSFSDGKDVFSSILETKTKVINNNVISGKIDAAVKTVIVNDTNEKLLAIAPPTQVPSSPATPETTNPGSSNEESYIPPIPETATLSDTDKAKSILLQARALQTSLNSMQNPAQSFGTQLNTVNKVWNDRSSLLALYLTAIIQDVGGQLGNSIKGAVTDQVVNLNTTQGVSCYRDAQSTLKTEVYDYNTQTSSVQNASCYVYSILHCIRQQT
jgi:hypothetical protein